MSTDDVSDDVDLRRAADDAALEPWALLKAVRDPNGRVVDFVYRDINCVAARQQQLQREDLLGRSVAESLPELVRSGVLDLYIRCIDTGEPLVLDDLSFYGRTLDGPGRQTRLYEMRGVRVETEYLSLNWRDVDQRYRTQQQLAESEERFRLLAENSSDVVAHFRNDVVVWVSPSVEASFGSPPQHWIGQVVESFVLAEDRPAFAEMIAQTATGHTVIGRLRLHGPNGGVHWVEVHAKLFFDTDGNPDGRTASLRVIDQEVADEQALEDARRTQAEADALYHEVMASAAVGMCITFPEGGFQVVNAAMCEFFGYDSTTLCTMGWQDVTAPEFLVNDLAKVEEILAGRLDGYRTTKQFIHAGGDRIWGDLSVGCLRGPSGEVQKFIGQIVDITADVEAREQLEDGRLLLAASADSMLDPQVLLEAVRGSSGNVLDFRYVSANRAAYSYLNLTEQELLGQSTLDTLPNLEESGLLARYAQCLADGQPVILSDFSYFNQIIDDDRRYDIRATRAGPDLLSLSWTDVTERYAATQRDLAAQTLLHATVDSMLNPQSLLEAVRDRTGQVIDFVYRSANRAFCSYRGWEEREIIGQSLLEAQPSLLSLGLFERYATCVDTGESVILDDFEMFNAMRGEDCRFDIRVIRAGVDLISLTFSDVTERYQVARRIADSEEQYRLLAENSTDIVCHVRNVNLVWVSPSIEPVLGAPPEYWLGQEVFAHVPPEDVAEQMALMATAVGGGAIRHRGRVIGVDGVAHWFDLRAKPFIDADGRHDGIAATLRLVDDEVAAEQRLTASEKQYRLLAENSSDMVTHVRDGRFAWTSPSVAQVVGATPEYWVGRPVREIIPPGDESAFAGRLATLEAGGVVQERIRVVSVDGVIHWVDLHARPVFDDDGQQDGFTGALRVVDVEVAAQQQIEKARRQQARTDALYRRSVDGAAIGMCLINAEGGFVDVNNALCDFFGYDAETLKSKTWQELTAEEYLQADLDNVADVLAGRIDSYRMTKGYIHADGHPIWGDLSVSCLRDDNGQFEAFISQITDITAEVETREQLEDARRKQAASDALYRRSVDSAAVGMCLADLEGNFIETNQALCEFFGYDAETLRHMTWQELTDPDYLEADLDNRAQVLAGEIESYRMVKRFIHADGHPIWGDLSVSCIRSAGGEVEMFIGQIADITAEVQAREQLAVARRQKQRDEERYRNSMDNAAVGMCLVTPEGRIEDVNEAMCRFFGYHAEAINGTHWQDFTDREFLDAELNSVNGILEGRIDSYRMVKHYQHADGHRIWGDLSVSGVRDGSGNLENMVALITDVTAEVQAREQLILSDGRNRALARSLQSDLDGAAKYLKSVLPGDLAGTVSVSSRYLPSQTLGGDCFDFHWIDDDHLLCYLLDVSGHGVESALIAVSVHNMLRSAALPTEAILEPDQVLAVLNNQFSMERHDGNYLTIFYAVYQRSTGTMRYAAAGHPPTMLISGGHITALPSQSPPVGMFDDTTFTTDTVPIPPASQLLLYSDGAFELSLESGSDGTLKQFMDLCARLAGSPDWTLDDLIDQLRQRSMRETFDDDCTLVKIGFE